MVLDGRCVRCSRLLIEDVGQLALQRFLDVFDEAFHSVIGNNSKSYQREQILEHNTLLEVTTVENLQASIAMRLGLMGSL